MASNPWIVRRAVAKAHGVGSGSRLSQIRTLPDVAAPIPKPLDLGMDARRVDGLVRRAVQFHALEHRLMPAAGPTARLIERVEWRFTSCGLSQSRPVPSSSWTASRSASCPSAHESRRWTTYL